MAISPQRLTIYLYSAHRAVIFAIAQLSCNTIPLAQRRNVGVQWVKHLGLLLARIIQIRQHILDNNYLLTSMKDRKQQTNKHTANISAFHHIWRIIIFTTDVTHRRIHHWATWAIAPPLYCEKSRKHMAIMQQPHREDATKNYWNCCCQMSDFKTKMQFRLRLRPRPCWGALYSAPDPLAGFKGPTSKWREGKNKETDEFICAAA